MLQFQCKIQSPDKIKQTLVKALPPKPLVPKIKALISLSKKKLLLSATRSAISLHCTIRNKTCTLSQYEIQGDQDINEYTPSSMGLKQTYSTTKLGTKQSYKPKTTEIRRYQSPYVQLCCPSSAEPGFTACGGEVSLGLILLPLGGKHLFEKNAVILLGSPALFSANQEKEYLESLAKDIMVEVII